MLAETESELRRWTPAGDAELRRLWLEGKSATEIAGLLGDGVTRNAVLGRLHRLRRGKVTGAALPLHEPARPVRAKRERHGNAGHPNVAGIRKRAERRQVEAERHEAEPNAGSLKILNSEIWLPLSGRVPVPLVELSSNQCRWPLGDPLQPGFGFCGCATAEGKSYCEPHRLAGTMGAGR